MHSALTITFRIQSRSCPRCAVSSSSRYLHKIDRTEVLEKWNFVYWRRSFECSTNWPIYLQDFLGRETGNESWFAYIQIIVSQAQLPVCIISPTVHFSVASQSECMLQTNSNISDVHWRNRFDLKKIKSSNMIEIVAPIDGLTELKMKKKNICRGCKNIIFWKQRTMVTNISKR